MRQLLTAIEYLHSFSIVHRDVKPANVYVMNRDCQNPEIVLADFGCAADLTENFDNQIVGSPAFIAPEVYAGKKCTVLFALTHRRNGGRYLVGGHCDVRPPHRDNAVLLGEREGDGLLGGAPNGGIPLENIRRGVGRGDGLAEEDAGKGDGTKDYGKRGFAASVVRW
jgi:serine/threonine protein kinase